jgi:hypothetical protein
VYTYDCLQDQVFPRTRHGNSTKRRLLKMREEAEAELAGTNLDDVVNNTNINGHTNNHINGQGRSSRNDTNGGSEKLLLNGGSHFKFCTKDYDSLEIFELDADLLALRSHITPEFEHAFQQAVDLYISGDWAGARYARAMLFTIQYIYIYIYIPHIVLISLLHISHTDRHTDHMLCYCRPLFERANQLMLSAAPSLRGDGPSKTLLRYMEAHSWSAQSIGWKGYRPLTSK